MKPNNVVRIINRLALMSTRRKVKKTTVVDQEGIDRLVISQADDDSAWAAPIRVERFKPAFPVDSRRAGRARGLTGQVASRVRRRQVR
jgi:hypothetical protein